MGVPIASRSASAAFMVRQSMIRSNYQDSILRYFGWHPCLCFLSLRLLTTQATQQQGESVEHYHRYEQQAVADQHAEVLQPSSDHNTKQVRGEGDVSSLAI